LDAAGSGPRRARTAGGLSQELTRQSAALAFSREETEIYAPIRALEDRETQELSSLNGRARWKSVDSSTSRPLAITKLPTADCRGA